jgi:CheY-like chemotaxis protein
MSRVRVVHWRAAEAEPLLAACRVAGHHVEYDSADLPATAKIVRRTMPEALVIDLTRVPSSGRNLAFAIRNTKYTRQIPIVFVDGEPEKVDAIRKQLPDAVYTPRKRVAAAIRTACKQVLINPAIPPTVNELYGSRSAAQKLGFKEGLTVALFDAPRDYVSLFGEIPEDVELVEDPEDIHPITLWFVRDPRDYQDQLPRKRSLAARSKLWVIWPKGATNGLTQNLVRAAANDVGLVDYKICSVDGRWSGMLFAPSRK